MYNYPKIILFTAVLFIAILVKNILFRTFLGKKNVLMAFIKKVQASWNSSCLMQRWNLCSKQLFFLLSIWSICINYSFTVFFVDQTWWKQCMNSIRTFSNNIGKTFDMWCLKRNQRLGMTFLQDRITHLEFIHPPLIIFAALKNNHIIMFSLSAIPIIENVTMYPASIQLSVYCWRIVRVLSCKVRLWNVCRLQSSTT